MGKYLKGRFQPTNPDKYLGNTLPTYRSGWELQFMRFCDNHTSVTKWSSEPIRLPYLNPLTGKQTVYVPDFLIQYQDREGNVKTELIEVKPANQAIQERVGRSKRNQAHLIVNQAKWQVARQYCKQQGMTFRVVTENDMFHTGRYTK